MPRREAVYSKQGWYPDTREAALKILEEKVPRASDGLKALAAIVPHAGWMYSAGVAGKVYGRIEIPGRVIVLCPMHRAMGAPVSLWDRGIWETPLGDAVVDEEFAACLMKNDRSVKIDYSAHALEHAIEIQLPFIVYRNPLAKIVPLRLGHLSFDECMTLAQSLAATMKEFDGPTLIVASTDMSHEDNIETLRHNDPLAMARIEALDPAGLYNTVQDNDISMCGFIPVTVALEAARLSGAGRVEKIDYANSADISGNYNYIVGYFGAVVY